MSTTRLLFFILLIALITGAINTSGFLLGSGTLLIINIIWPILAIVFVITLISYIIRPRSNNKFENHRHPHKHFDDELR